MSISSQNEPTQPIRVSSSPAPIPTGIPRKAQDHDLGPIIAMYPSRPMGFSAWFLVVIAIVVTILIPFLYGIWSGYQGYLSYGPAVVISRCAGWISFSFIAFLLLFLFLVRCADRSLLICRRGILLRKAPFVLLPERTIRAYPWHKVNGISTHVTGKKKRGPQGEQAIPHVQTAIIYPSKGSPVRLNENNRIFSSLRGYYCVGNLADFCTRLKAFLYKDLLPRLEKEFTASHEIIFGPVSIQEKYLQIRKTDFSHKPGKIAWDQVHRLTIEAGKLVIELDEGKPDVSKYHIPVSRIPNIELMLHVIDRHVR